MLRYFIPAAMIALSACGGGAEEETASISVGNAFVMVPLEGRDVTMGGFDASVNGGNLTLVEATAPDIAETVEIHTVAMEDGTMRMRKVDGLEIADGETLQLERGGNHLMFFGAGDLIPGEAYDIRLVFETADGERKVVDVVAAARAIGE